LIGPILNRAVLTLPRRGKHYLYRAAYPGALFLLLCTAWQVLAGTQIVRNTGDFARFGGLSFQIMAPLQLALALFTAAMWSAASIAAEKDRRTLDLILLTNLSSAQYVLGKLLGSLLLVWLLLLAALPIFSLALLFGGIAAAQVGRVFAVTLVTTLLAGSLGTTLALWREKTFQTLAITATLIVLWLALWEIVASGTLGPLWLGIATERWAVAFSPWRAILAATQPIPVGGPGRSASDATTLFVPCAMAVAAALTLWGIVRFRVWNPPRERVGRKAPALAAMPAALASSPLTRRSRPVWPNPIMWREVRTWAYGRKLLLVRGAYLSLCLLAAAALYVLVKSNTTGMSLAVVMVPLFVLSLVLVNAQAVTSITTERDGKALDLLLVTDLTAREFIYGKLAGALYNTKEMVLAPVILCLALWAGGVLTLENALYLTGGALVLYLFVTMLGIHVGLAYGHSPTAIAVSLGTVFFLFVGIATCMRVIVAFAGSFQVQLQPFLAFMVGGGVGLFVALGARNPSTAILATSLLCPFVTFYAITSFLLGQTLNVFLVTTAMYSFATAAMLIPATHEFDVAASRSTAVEE
jgi:ABC-type Na+ efflux pump permease subunit